MKRMQWKWSKWSAVVAGVIVLCCFIFPEVNAGAEEKVEILPVSKANPEAELIMFEPVNPEPELMEKIQEYVATKIDPAIYASLHLEWDGEEPIIVISVTEDLADGQEAELRKLAGKETRLEIRLVDYSEQELLQKQAEIDHAAFEGKGVKIWHTGINVFTNRVDVGIDPYNEETAQLIYDKYGDEMITVMEGHEIVPLDLSATSEMNGVQDTLLLTEDEAEAEEGVLEIQIMGEQTAAEEDSPGFFQRLWRSVSNWFSKLFS